jgi:PPM family protein phosphatase
LDTQRDEQRVALDVADVAGFEAPRGRERWPRVAACTRPGRGRDDNEDALVVRAKEGIFLVADGMGGHRGAARAAQLTASELPEAIQGALDRLASRDHARIQAALLDQLTRFSERLRALDGEMGATVVVAVVRGRTVFLAHAGDSRAHRFRDGALRTLTRDHTMVQSLVDAGRLDVLSAALHPQRGALLRYLGMPRLAADVRAVRVRTGDRLLLTSDGVHSLLPGCLLERVLGAAPSPSEAARSLIDLVAARGGRDDASAIVLDW